MAASKVELTADVAQYDYQYRSIDGRRPFAMEKWEASRRRKMSDYCPESFPDFVPIFIITAPLFHFASNSTCDGALLARIRPTMLTDFHSCVLIVIGAEKKSHQERCQLDDYGRGFVHQATAIHSFILMST
jgi:hypothetical protein